VYSPLTGFQWDVYEVVRMARQMVLGTGHWCVWATVLRPVMDASTPPWNVLAGGGGQALFRAILVQYPPGENAWPLFDFQPDPATVLPGTDLTRMPVP
ncbi:MAG TPA: hypothetical protein VFQ45_18975, partial [Longimicrobium sp.]|nr:hypothetical protein [Longimicrobium sp.]